tara:strand:+ start:16 stop:168 length:153 start_codon:yes stop_codon:yes gene_type:complete
MENEIAQLEYGKNYDELSEAQQREVDYQLEDAIVGANYQAIIDYWDSKYE